MGDNLELHAPPPDGMLSVYDRSTLTQIVRKVHAIQKSMSWVQCIIETVKLCCCPPQPHWNTGPSLARQPTTQLLENPLHSESSVRARLVQLSIKVKRGVRGGAGPGAQPGFQQATGT